jgi:hypothetical protein
MSEPEPVTHSFVIKIWRETLRAGSNRATWRGYITHVPNGERHYLRRLTDVKLFIAAYLAQMGIRVGVVLGARLWLWRRARAIRGQR